MLKSFIQKVGPFTIDCDGKHFIVLKNGEAFSTVAVELVEQKAMFLNCKAAGHFHNYLFKAWQRADIENRRSLLRAFPAFSLAALDAFGHFNKYKIQVPV